MPQMSPIMWNMMLMLTTSTIMMIMMKLFFMTDLKMNKSYKLKKSTMKSWKW
nr:ATP synthase F0 subunit 8 [Penthicodes variegata]